MHRIMSNNRLMILIQTNPYLKSILKSCKSADQLEVRLVNTPVLRTICLYDINWAEIYRALKEV